MPEEPERLVRTDPPARPSGGGYSQGSGIRELIKIVSPALVVGLVIYLFILPSYVTKVDEAAHVNSLTGNIASLTSSLKGDQGTIAAMSTQIAGISRQIQDLQSLQNSLNSTVAGHTAQLNSTPTKVQLDALQTQINTIATRVDSLPATIKADYTAQITTLQTSLNTISQQVTTLVNTANTTATTTTTTGGTTSGVLPTTIVGNPFTGSQTLGFSPIAANSATSQTFSFTLNNNTGKAITNIQFAIGLEILDANNNVLTAGLPQGTTVSITSSGTATVWTQQSTGINYILGFTNTAPTGIFGGIGVLSQAVGTATYNVTVTVTTGVNATSQFNVFPIVKVVSYS